VRELGGNIMQEVRKSIGELDGWQEMGGGREDATRRFISRVCSAWNIIEVERGEGFQVVEEGQHMSKDAVSCPVPTSTVSPAFNDSGVVAMHPEVLRSGCATQEEDVSDE
jgi:hypothetical protein